MTPLNYESAKTTPQQSNLQTIAQHMFCLMMRNMSSDGFVFTDPNAAGCYSKQGCIIASPSYTADLTIVDQDYVYNWTRDAAVTAIEIAATNMPTEAGAGVQPLIDYVNFASICQNSGAPTIGHACFTIEGQPRRWSEQSDGPALQTLAILQAFPQLDTLTQATAKTIIGTNINYLLNTYQNPTTNLWEETSGFSFFARSVQLRCFTEILSNTHGITVPSATAGAMTWLENALQNHWIDNCYVSILSPDPSILGYDPNIDIVMASVYGAIPYTDTKLLATAAQLRRLWADSSSNSFYPINAADQNRGIGPMLGRYPLDKYDGDTQDPVLGGHPWALCSANFAELYYGLANAITQTKTVPFDNLSEDFFNLIGVSATTPLTEVVAALQTAGDEMLNAIIFHSDHLELSEQFDGTTGYEKSVRDLTWSYAAFLSAVRAKTGRSVQG